MTEKLTGFSFKKQQVDVFLKLFSEITLNKVVKVCY